VAQRGGAGRLRAPPQRGGGQAGGQEQASAPARFLGWRQWRGCLGTLQLGRRWRRQAERLAGPPLPPQAAAPVAPGAGRPGGVAAAHRPGAPQGALGGRRQGHARGAGAGGRAAGPSAPAAACSMHAFDLAAGASGNADALRCLLLPLRRRCLPGWRPRATAARRRACGASTGTSSSTRRWSTSSGGGWSSSTRACPRWAARPPACFLPTVMHALPAPPCIPHMPLTCPAAAAAAAPAPPPAPQLEVSIVFRQQRLQYDPPLEELRARHYRELLGGFLGLPQRMRGVSELSERPGFFRAIADCCPAGVARLYSSAEALFARLQEELKAHQVTTGGAAAPVSAAPPLRCVLRCCLPGAAAAAAVWPVRCVGARQLTAGPPCWRLAPCRSGWCWAAWTWTSTWTPTWPRCRTGSSTCACSRARRATWSACPPR
jgi:hypothetical protein